MKHKTTEMKNSLERFNSIFELVKENINKLENRSIEIINMKNNKKKGMKKNINRASDSNGIPSRVLTYA